MGTRVRRTAVAVVIVCSLGLLAAPPAAAAAGAEPPSDPTTLVDPFVGTAPGAPDFHTGGGAGNTFPGAARPFGMVQWSPDTTPAASMSGGYGWNDSTITGFSVRHLSGPGCAVYGDVPIMPTTRALALARAAVLDQAAAGVHRGTPTRQSRPRRVRTASPSTRARHRRSTSPSLPAAAPVRAASRSPTACLRLCS